MLKKIGAVLLAAGLVLPYSPGLRVITAVWDNATVILLQGSTVLILIAYVLHAFVPPLARFHQRYGQALHGFFRMVFFVLAGGFLATASAGRLGVHGGLCGGGRGRGLGSQGGAQGRARGVSLLS